MHPPEVVVVVGSVVVVVVVSGGGVTGGAGGGMFVAAVGASASLMINFSNWPSVSASSCEPVYTWPAESPQETVPSALLPHTMLSQLPAPHGLSRPLVA